SRAGFRGYLVGGSLRDLLRGETPHDFDMTTNATPEEMLEVFADFRVIPTGLKHGTLTVLSDGNPVEVTTHRRDGDYLDARHPESVSFTRALEDDLSRRDFTVNAMAWSEETGLVDLFGGQNDLQKGVLRAVGAPAVRFSEDALRILRAFRFSAQLGFEIEPATLDAARAMREGLARISAERIFSEFSRLLVSPHAGKGLNALFAAACEPYVFFDTTPDRDVIPKLCELPFLPELRLALLLHDESIERAVALCRALRTSNAFADALTGFLAASREQPPTSFYEARRFCTRDWGYWENALALCRACGADVSVTLALCRTVVRDKSAIELRRLAVNGRELQETVGVAPARTGELLARLQDLVWQDPTRNKKATLLALAREIVEREPSFGKLP
ncbi:MAG: hypothetical protein IJW22_03900, partial [Clostridia bacterium]|nr:hypothetical protein [Clostridia bacterium]